jgi:Tfp pilus assembly protein PilF
VRHDACVKRKRFPEPSITAPLVSPAGLRRDARRRTSWTIALGLLIGGLALGGIPASAGAQAAGKMTLTTSSPEARRLYLQGFELLKRRRYSDAYVRCRDAVGKDPAFAAAHLCMYVTTGSKTEALEEIRRAMSLADQVTEPERLWIVSDDAIVRGDEAAEKAALTRLVTLLPDDEHAHYLLGSYYYRRRDYPAAIEAYRKATQFGPSFTLAYNPLG